MTVPPTPPTQETEDLMSVLGHELRSPLTTIRGAATLLLQAHAELPPEKVTELLAVIDSAAARMADRVEDVLVTGRLEGARQRVLVEDVDVSDVIADVLEAAPSRAAGRRIRAPGVVEGITVRGDEQRVHQVLRVLVENAVRFSPPGSPVEVRVERRGGQARIDVRDRGRGIPAADRERIFGRGVKLDAAGPGAGLGLYVAAGLMEIMDGAIGVEPRTGGGSTFWFTLPAPGK
jgi:two-component system, OmpR family, sensor histidine kinase KdpD